MRDVAAEQECFSVYLHVALDAPKLVQETDGMSLDAAKDFASRMYARTRILRRFGYAKVCRIEVVDRLTGVPVYLCGPI